jgi:hypothetical protein
MTHQENKGIKKVLYFVALTLLLIGVAVGEVSKVAHSENRCSCPYTKTKQYGGEGGQAFADDLTEVVQIKSITIRHGRYVDSIQTTWLMTSGHTHQGPRHGGDGGTEDKIVLADGEFITSITGRAASYVDQLTFYTNKGNKWGPYGGNGGQPFETGELKVGGFFGRCADYVDAIGMFNGIGEPKPVKIQKSK